jgi:hypothetical protein
VNARDYAERIVADLAGPGLRKARTPVVDDTSALSEMERSNLRSKEAFVVALEGAGLGEDSIRTLAAFFGVKRSTLFERMSRRRTDLAPLPEWFAKLADYAEFNRLCAVFLKQA